MHSFIFFFPTLFKPNPLDGKESKPGDLIEIIRGNYSHWAVYVGNGYVVHFGAPSKLNIQMFLLLLDGIVMKEKLEDVAGKDKWRVNNSLDKKYKPLPPDEIVKKACSLVGVSLKYHLTKYNCEHFATEMRYGKAESRQVVETLTVENSALRESVSSIFDGMSRLSEENKKIKESILDLQSRSMRD
uniref:LRAT domain-containing protein n=1 Tax=Oryzias latipes TaxID=8090 RepID=A0A3P9IWJ8_ORYLA